MASPRAQYYALIAGLEHSDSRLYDALRGLGEDVFDIIDELHPPEAASRGLAGGVPAGSVDNFIATIYSNNIRLTWSPLPGIVTYEVRHRPDGLTVWETATSLLHTSTTSVDVNPLTLPALYGTHTFLLRASNSAGIESESVSSVAIIIYTITAPVITPTVIDNNVLLVWTIPTSQFLIQFYNIYRNGVLIGTNSGNFISSFETVSGTFEYGIAAVDMVGNIGTRGTVVAVVNQPPDFELKDVQVSNLDGTKVNVKKEGIYLLCSVNLTETYQTHFTSHSWTSPMAQLMAGYPYVMEPATLTGSYEEVIDYGTVISNTIISLTWSTLPIAGHVTTISKIAFSTDGTTYSSFATGTSLYAPAVRYAKIRIEFTGDNTQSLIYFYHLQTTLNVKREIDSGAINCLAADSSGTSVLFNKSFKDIDSITLTALSTANRTAVYDFVDIPNPTGFKILVFNAGGARVDAFVSWKARGIV